ncbi:phage tail protein [Escherichia coli]|uniref:phage tail protein n=1 Tax=Escherichia coli TaxID=562 RepID=UPI001755E681|nr:phage tail protein [Escherichia coli]HAJ6679042.1 phage tail protein [Escherichia coli]
MAKNDFKAFATDRSANVISQEEWEALPALLSGFTAGKASSAQVNKVIRQASFIAAALAQFVSDKTQRDVLDNGDLPGFVELLGSGFAVEYLSRKNPFGDIKSDGTVQTALENLGLGEAAKRDVGTTVGTVAAGDDLRITGALQKENNLYELTNKSDARANLGLGTVATKNVGNSAGQIPDMSYWSSPAGGINFPNGFQMRFGTIAGTGGKLFSTPFTNQCYGIVFGQTYGANYWMFSPMYRASDLSNTGFAFINKTWSGAQGTPLQEAGESVFYIAIGY